MWTRFHCHGTGLLLQQVIWGSETAKEDGTTTKAD
jgi:hypothetical protein